ncbi:hypothetical protein TIFTF001_049179 [Ficus carica]|uniref:Toprim domain-containing protein n=1 Tax=Ficus carica TaxID=3494 RepID=A0AA87Z3H2_FICCA|nr:hypothetical protein TIFTF001_049179 [Ficus carica]
MWRCFRFDCGWAGRVFADDRAEDDRTERKFRSARQLTEQAFGLVPLGDEEKDTEKVLCGLDDIVDAEEIIIVERKLDKLSVEEAGFQNCVSVPGGAPGKDTAFQYLWNCKQYLDKASRIILATDGDPPGQTLRKSLHVILGKKVLVCLGVALKDLRSRTSWDLPST